MEKKAAGYLTKAMIARSVADEGNPEELVKLMLRAEAGEKLTLAFLGGSITQGSCSSTPETCYAYLVYSWFTKKFKKAAFTYINAGIGGTTSQFGVTRLADDVSRFRPDFCMVEFSVNDAANPFFEECYEAVIRRLRKVESHPALLIMHNLFYDTGVNTQAEHAEIGRAYGIPLISVRDALRPEIEAGRIVRTDISPDGLHPNDDGHAILASLVEEYLEALYAGRIKAGKADAAAASVPVTVNAMEHLRRYRSRSHKPVCNGFKPDYSVKHNAWDRFEKGWTAARTGDEITYSFTGSELAIQYRKTINRPAPIAAAVIDGDEKNPVILDANFDEDWGDSLHIDTLLYHGKRVDPKAVLRGRVQFGKLSEEEAAAEAELAELAAAIPEPARHTVTIRIIETHENDRVPFYLMSFISG